METQIISTFRTRSSMRSEHALRVGAPRRTPLHSTPLVSTGLLFVTRHLDVTAREVMPDAI
jgi:hypothetical protein